MEEIVICPAPTSISLSPLTPSTVTWPANMRIAQAGSPGNLDFDLEAVVAVMYEADPRSIICRRWLLARNEERRPRRFRRCPPSKKYESPPGRCQRSEACGPGIDHQNRPGEQKDIASLAARSFCLGESGDIAGQENHGRDVTEQSHGFRYAGGGRLVPGGGLFNQGNCGSLRPLKKTRGLSG